jgi:hypothetical protein
MNISISWIAIKGIETGDVLQALGLKLAADRDRRSREYVHVMDGWTIVLSMDFNFPTPERMAAVSAGGIAIGCSMDNRVMFSVARGYAYGQAVWAIEHDGGQKGSSHLAVAGDPPPEWAAVRQHAERQQAEEDAQAAEVDFVFEAPMDLALALSGYRFDECAETPLEFRPLVRKASGDGGLGKFFGALFKSRGAG